MDTLLQRPNPVRAGATPVARVALPAAMAGGLLLDALTGFIGSSRSRVYVGSESSGFEQTPRDVVAELAEAERGPAEALEASGDGLGAAVASAGLVDERHDVRRALLQRAIGLEDLDERRRTPHPENASSTSTPKTHAHNATTPGGRKGSRGPARTGDTRPVNDDQPIAPQPR